MVARIDGGLVAISPGSTEIADQSLGINGPSFWNLIAAKDGLFWVISQPDIWVAKKCDKMGPSYSRLGPRKRASWIGGGLVAISPGSAVNRGPILGN